MFCIPHRPVYAALGFFYSLGCFDIKNVLVTAAIALAYLLLAISSERH